MKIELGKRLRTWFKDRARKSDNEDQLLSRPVDSSRRVDEAAADETTEVVQDTPVPGVPPGYFPKQDEGRPRT